MKTCIQWGSSEKELPLNNFTGGTLSKGSQAPKTADCVGPFTQFFLASRTKAMVGDVRLVGAFGAYLVLGLLSVFI